MRKVNCYYLKNNWCILKLKCNKWALVNGDELFKILQDEEKFLKDYMITLYNTKQALTDKYSKEPCYKHLFE